MNTNELYAQFYSLVESRYSCRKYADTPVSDDLLKAILDAARLAPSATNRQPWTFFVANTPEWCRKIAECYGRDWVDNVPAFIIACGHHDAAWHRADGKDHTDVDLSIAIEHICLAATALGLGSCWICNFDEPKLRATLNLEPATEAIAIIPIGYPAADVTVPEKKRKEMEEVTRWLVD